MDIGDWLRSLGLGKFEAAFRENEIDETVLPSLTRETLKELGVTAVGHRLKLLDAITALRGDASGTAPSTLAATAPAAPSGPPEDRAERRQVTVMFSDLVGSTALSARMDPEDLREVISAYQKCVAETVQRFGGFVAKYMGDGVLIYFWYPASSRGRRRAGRARRTGVGGGSRRSEDPRALTDARRHRNRSGGRRRSRSAQAHLRSRRLLGETPNLAARLQGIAEPNSVVIAEGTRRLVGNLFEASGPRSAGPQGYLRGRCGPGRHCDRLPSKAASTLSTQPG